MNIIDKLIAPFSPQSALKRTIARQKLKAVEGIQNSGYSRHGASKTKKSLLGWNSKGASPDEDIIDNLKTLRERSRDLYMGSPLATGALKTIRTNVVGAGLKLNARIDYEFLGLTADQADEWEKNVEREWRLWANSRECDAARMMTFGQLQSLVVLSELMNGDVFSMLPVIPRKGSVYDLRVALIEADRVCDPKVKPELPEGYKLSGGVVRDKYGAPVYCYITNNHPGTLRGQVDPKFEKVPFFGAKTGRPNVLYIAHNMERVGQIRAAPYLSPVIEALKQLGRYTEAELMAAVVSGMFTVFIQSNEPDNPLESNIPDDEHVDSDENSLELGNGAIIGLNPGETANVANPGRPNAAFDGFVTSVARQIGAALEVPYELLIKHFTASYSASRGALLEAWKMFRMRRAWLVESFCQPIYEEWLAEAVAKGRISAPGFFSDPLVRAAWCGAEWYGPTQGQLDPLKEANAAKIRVEEEFSTRTREAAELTGEDWDRVHKLRAREESQRREDGTIINSSQLVAVTEGDDDDE